MAAAPPWEPQEEEIPWKGENRGENSPKQAGIDLYFLDLKDVFKE